MVLMRQRRPEQSHDAVAGEVVDRPLEAMYALAKERQEPIHHQPPLLRVHLRG